MKTSGDFRVRGHGDVCCILVVSCGEVCVGNFSGAGIVRYIGFWMGGFGRVRVEGLEEFRVWGLSIRAIGVWRFGLKDRGGVGIWGLKGFCL